MKYKRPLFFILFTALVITFAVSLTFSSSAASKAILTVEDSDLAVAGKEFTLSVTLSDNPGFSKAQLSVGFNKSYLSLVGVYAGDIIEGDDATVGFTDNGNGSCSVSIDVPYDVPDNGTLISVRFKLSGSVKLNTRYTVSIGGEMLDSAGQTLSVEARSGGFYLTCAHSYTDKTVLPTCTAEGYTEHRCNECQKSYQDMFTAKIPHSWRTIRSSKPSCTEDGTLVHTCTVCSFTETVTNGTALGHDYVESKVIAPTCMSEGYTECACSRCGKTIEIDYKPVIDHILVEHVQTAPTCQNKGVSVTYCTMCETIFATDDIPRTNHDYVVKEVVAPTHTAKGFTSYECSFCKAILKDNYTDVKPYDIVYSTEVEAACDHEGLKVGVCSDGCGYRVEEVIPALAHTFGEWKVVKEAGEDEEGLERHVCAVCGLSESMPIPPIRQQGDNIDPVPNKINLSATTLTVMAGAAALVVLIIVFLIIVFRLIRRKAPEK